jgi:hypothetical protein
MDEHTEPSCRAVSDASDMHMRPSCISNETTSSTRGGNASQIRTSADRHGPNSSERLQLGRTEIIERQKRSVKCAEMEKDAGMIQKNNKFNIPYILQTPSDLLHWKKTTRLFHSENKTVIQRTFV